MLVKNKYMSEGADVVKCQYLLLVYNYKSGYFPIYRYIGKAYNITNIINVKDYK